MRERAQQLGALPVLAGAEVLGIDKSDDGRVSGVRTSERRRSRPSVCAICCGVWSPRIARMAGARIPLTPIVHQMISVGPIALFAGTDGRDHATRSSATSTRTCTSASTAATWRWARTRTGRSSSRPDDIPSIEEAVLSPTELPFTQDDFDPQLEQALELMPELLGDERVGIRYAINGLISMTPDGHPVLGRDARGARALVGGRQLDQGGARASAARWPSG